MNTILFIDLSNRKTIQKEITEHERKLFLGGRGLNSYLLFKYLKPGINPLSSENILIFGAGLLTGTLSPSSARFTVTSKSPESLLLGDSNCGGFWGPELRFSGVDHLIITGKSKKPVYIFIEDGEVDFNDASHIWGFDTYETQEAILNDHPGSQVVCIGPAGENLVKFACIIHGLKNAAGRTGLGCVMGSKNIKAIAVKGRKGLEISHPKELINKTKEYFDLILKTKVYSVLSKYGTPYLYDIHNYLGIIGTLNHQLTQLKEGESLESDNIKKLSHKMASCYCCPVHCRHCYSLGNTACEGPEYSTLGSFGPMLGINDIEFIFEANNLCNRFGLDTSSTGRIIAWAMELYQHKILTEKDTGLKLEWGNKDVALDLIKQIAYRKGFGSILAEGGYLASRKIGKNSEKYLMQTRRIFQSDPVDVRGHKGFALGLAVSSRGSDHLRSRPTLEALCLPEEVLEGIFGEKVSSDPTSYSGKARMVVWSENLYAVNDSVGICRFVSKFNSPHLLGFEEFSELIYLAFNIQVSSEELNQIGERIINIERLINMREGAKKEDDTLPERYFDEKCRSGEKIDKEKFRIMLDEYYQLRGWDTNGKPKNQYAWEDY